MANDRECGAMSGTEEGRAADSNSLDGTLTGEINNLAGTRTELKSLWETVDPTVCLYEILSQCLQDRSDRAGHEEFYGISVFLLSAKRSAAIGALTLGRLHLQEAAYMTRRCLELVGFSYRAWKEPAALHKWLHAGRDAAAYDEYQDAFSSRKLRGDLAELGSDLLDKYDRTNRMIHSSLYSVARSYEQAEVEGGKEVRVHMFDIQRRDQWPSVALELLTTIDCHLSATSALARRLLEGKPARESRRRWKQAHDPAVAAHRREKAAWRLRLNAHRADTRRRIDSGLRP
jgi:hypothetical protein